MMTINNIQTFFRKNKSPCRVFWGFMYTIYFMVGWVSFYSTKVCNDYMSLIERANKSKITILSMHVVLGVGVYGLLIISVLRLVYLLHQTIKEKVENAKRVWGTVVVVAIYKVLVTLTFPYVCACMSCFLDTPSLWAFIGIAGSIYCLFICYVNPDDYGVSDGFFGLVIAIFINVDNKIGRYVLVAIILVSTSISKEIDANKKVGDNVEILKPSIESANYNSTSINDSQKRHVLAKEDRGY